MGGGKSKSVTVGYRYKMGLHFIMTRWADSLKQILVGERSAWIGPVTENETITIDMPELFGGDKREGGVVGDADVEFGLPTQGANAYLVSQLGTPMPGHRGATGLVFKGGIITSNNPYIKPWWFRIGRIHVNGDGTQEQWYDEKAEIPLSVESASRQLVATYNVDINALTNSATSGAGMVAVAAADITTQSGDTVECWINYNGPFISWSPWGVPAASGAPGSGTHTGTSYSFRAVKDNNTGSPVALGVSNAGSDPGFDGYEAARDAFAAIQPEVMTGATRYRFGIIDSPTADNSGGISIQVRVYRGLSFEAMNPIHIVRECLTDPYFRLQYPDTMIDDTTFEAEADVAFDEGLGLCYFWNRQTEVTSFIQEILDHAGGTYYSDPETGKFVVKLFRGDYVAADLDIYDETSIIDVEEFERGGPGEVVNEITVIYTDVVTGNTKSVTVQNNASIQEQGYVVSKTVRYPWAPTAAIAARLAQRDLTAISSNLAQAKVRFTRKAWPLRPGSVIKISWAKLGISELICRVLEIDYGLLEAGEIVCKLAEDVFGLPTTSFQADQPSGWEPPPTEPLAITVQDVVEAPYWEVARNVSAGDLAAIDADSALVLTLAATPAAGQMGYQIYSRVSPAEFESRASGSYTGTAVLYDALEQSDNTVTFISSNGFEPGVGDLIMVGQGRSAEFMEVTDVDDLDIGSIVVNRGILDTVPGEHDAGARIWVVEDAWGLEDVEHVTAESVDVRLTSFTGEGESPFEFATNMNIVPDQRFWRPYPPGNVEINGEQWPSSDVFAGFITTWAHRDREQQTASYIAQEEASIGPEPGTTYNLRFYDDDTDVLKWEAIEINDDHYLMPDVAGIFNARLELSSTRETSAFESWQTQVRYFSYIGNFPVRGARLWKSTSTTLPEGTDTTLTWDNEFFDFGGYFDSGVSTSNFTIPSDAAGWHYITVNDVHDLGSQAWYSMNNITAGVGSSAHDTGSTAQCYERSVTTTYDNARSYGDLRSMPAGATVRNVANWVSGAPSGSRTIEANAKWAIGKVWAVNPKGAMARRTANQTITTSTETTVTFDTEQYDQGGFIDIATQATRVTIPTGEDGWYIITAGTRWSTATTTVSRRMAAVRKNGSGPFVGVREIPAGGTNATISVPAQAIEYLSAADYLELRAFHSHGSNFTLGFNQSLTVAKVDTADTVGATIRYDGSAQTISTGSDVLITFDTEVYDDGGIADLGTNNDRLTVQEDGLYAVTGHLQFSAVTGTVRILKLVVDGTTEIARDSHQAENASARVPCCNPTAIVSLNAGQYIQMYANVGTSCASMTGDTRPRMSIVLLAKEQSSS